MTYLDIIGIVSLLVIVFFLGVFLGSKQTEAFYDFHVQQTKYRLNQQFKKRLALKLAQKEHEFRLRQKEESQSHV